MSYSGWNRISRVESVTDPHPHWVLVYPLSDSSALLSTLLNGLALNLSFCYSNLMRDVSSQLDPSLSLRACAFTKAFNVWYSAV